MQFPVSREDLLNYRNSKYKAAADSKVKSIVESVCAGVINTVEKTDAHRYIYPAEHDLVFAIHRATSHPVAPVSQQLVINRVLEDLKQKFPDCAIVLDPLVKTITVDWSKQGPGDWTG